MKSLLVTVLLSLACAQGIYAQESSGQKDRELNPSQLTGQSPFRELPKPSDRQFVRDDQPGVLDTICTTRSEGPLRIKIPIDRVITKLAFDESPSSPYQNVIGSQVADLYLSPKLKIMMPVYDVDAPLEIDEVSFNGHPVGRLSGSNGTWKMNVFEADIRWVKFGQYNEDGTPSLGIDNEIRIDINTTDHPSDWCTAVDWVAVTFESMSPIVLIHGNSSEGAFFYRQGLTEVLDNHHWLYDRSLNLVPSSSSIEDPVLDEDGNVVDQPNNYKINLHLKKMAKAFGVDSLHLVMHSKGGLDTRSYLALYQPSNNKQFKILSYTSLATPHNGSILADIVVQRAEAAKRAFFIEYDDNFPSWSRQVFYLSSVAPGHYNLTTDYLRGFNQRNIRYLSPSETRFNATAADADKDGNNAISVSVPLFPREDEGLARESFLNWYSANLPASFPAGGLPTVMYRTIKDVKAVRVEIRPGTVPIYNVARFIGTRTDSAQFNDTLVSRDSGFGVGSFEQIINSSGGGKEFYSGPSHPDFPSTTGGANHATIARRSGVAVISWIYSADHQKGDWDR